MWEKYIAKRVSQGLRIAAGTEYHFGLKYLSFAQRNDNVFPNTSTLAVVSAGWLMQNPFCWVGKKW